MLSFFFQQGSGTFQGKNEFPHEAFRIYIEEGEEGEKGGEGGEGGERIAVKKR